MGLPLRRVWASWVPLGALILLVIAAGLAGAQQAPQRVVFRSLEAHPAIPAVVPSPTSPGTAAASTALPAGVTSVSLPAGDAYQQISVTANGGLLLFGEPIGATTSSSSECVAAAVDPQTLTVAAARPIICGSPGPTAQTAEMVFSNFTESSGDFVNVTIEHLDPVTGLVTEGPVVMTYQDCSDCRPVIADGSGSLWIYDNDTTVGSELLEVSDSSGQVVDTVRMPQLDRPLLSAYDDGVVVANSLHNGLYPGEFPPSAVYYVAAGADSPTALVGDTSLIACWMVADADHLWIGTGSTFRGCTQGSVLRLDGLDTQPVFDVPASVEIPWSVVGGESTGLWTVEWSEATVPTSAQPQVVSINPDTGAQTVTATLPPVYINTYFGSMTDGEGVLLDGWLYLLEPPVGGGGGYSSLLRIKA
jgi:hypothetical protein